MTGHERTHTNDRRTGNLGNVGERHAVIDQLFDLVKVLLGERDEPLLYRSDGYRSWLVWSWLDWCGNTVGCPQDPPEYGVIDRIGVVLRPLETLGFHRAFVLADPDGVSEAGPVRR